MIAKRIEFRNVNLSSFSKLVTYITNAQGKNERVGDITLSNCQSETPGWAAIEAEAVQAKNKRTRMDKTYHLLVSFREGDHPSAEVLKDIETRICDKLGYKEHQRVSAVHYDTDHMHIHIAINKIHPTRFTAHEPYFDKKNLGVLCDVLEKEYGLAVDNHIARNTPGEAKAQDMEKAAGIESLIGWIKRGCLPELLAAQSWQELHTILAQNGLTLSERGNGLVVSNGNGIAAKASSISRNFSKNALEKRLGVFEPCVVQEVKIERCYEVKPVASKVDTKKLWEFYQQERLQHKQRHTVLKDRAKQRKMRRVESAKKMATTKRAAITLTKGRMARNILYRSISNSFLEEMRIIHKDFKEDTSRVYEKGKHLVWYDWLKAKAWEGNTEALEVLRNRYDRGQLRVNSIASGIHETIDRINYRAGAKIEAVTKRGTIHYQIAQTVLRDDGKVFRLAETVSQEAIEASLKIAMQRFGSTLAINGTETFRRQAVEVAARTNMKLSFTSPELEAQRKTLAATSTHTTDTDAAALYIQERTETRSKGIDILPHRRYADSDAGTHSFAGIRQVEGKTLMLLQTPSEMLVLSIDDTTAYRIRHLSIGDTVEINTQGIVRSRGRRI
jgi:hypothetical protein